MTVVYFTRGPMVSDRCEHEHRTIDEAKACIAEHVAAGGLRREVYRREMSVDGRPIEMRVFG